MSVVKINVLTVPAERREVLEQRFASRAGEVEQTPGFESFQLLRPTDDSDRYYVVTQWASDEAFRAWMDSRAFRQGHTRAGGDAAADHGSGDGGGHGGGEGHGRSGDGASGPAASQAELLSFEVVQEARRAD